MDFSAVVCFLKGNIHFQLPPIGNRAGSVEKFLTKSLKALQLDYVDLYLIHLPVGFQDKGDDTLWPRDETGEALLDTSTDLISLWKVNKCM
jgi:diketogulonate reductase-like aldo/keto reductase